MSWGEILDLAVPPSDHRIQYGDDALMFGELRLPKGKGPYAVAVAIHGCCWRAENDITHISHLSAALTRAGIATWTLEYRRIGDTGGGWPGTFMDAARGADYLRTLAGQYPLDTNRVVFVGHSAKMLATAMLRCACC